VSYIDVQGPVAGWAGCGMCGGINHSTHQHRQALAASPSDDPRTALIKAGITVLTQANQRAKQLAEAIVKQSTLFSRSATQEWATRFTATVESMVVRAITPGKDGNMPFEKSPGLIKTIGDFVASEASEVSAMHTELLSLSGGLNQAAEAIAKQAVDLAVAAATGAMNGFPPIKTNPMVYVVGGLAGLALLAYVVRAFR